MKRFFSFINIKLIRDFTVWVLCMSFHKYVSEYVYNKGLEVDLPLFKPLYDIVQENTPNLQPYRFIPEILHLIPVLLLVYLIIYNYNNRSILALRKFLRVHGLLMFLRAICFSSTLLPDSSQMCLTSSHIGSCYDLIFSGHSTIVHLSTYILVDYFNINKCIKNILYINNFIICFLIIACRNHYTIDIIVSIIATNYVYFQDNDKPFLFPDNTYPLYF
jgi:hypothetical protein